MKNEFIPYKEALALKELDFDEPCFSYYQFQELSICPRENGDDIKYPGDNKFDRHQNSYLEENDDCSAPLYQQAFRWFREKHGLHNVPLGFTDNKGQVIYHIGKPTEEPYKKKDTYKTYQEAQDACLRKLIEIVNKNKEDDF